MEQVWRRLDGQPIPVEVKGTSFHYQGQRAIMTIIRDITEAKKIQQRFLQYERLAAVGKVIAAIAHEIRNPLVIVSGMTQILKAKMESRSEFTQELSTILGQTDQLRLFMNDILDYSRDLQIRKVPVELQGIVESALIGVQAQLGLGHVNVQVRREWGSPVLQVWADGERLEQVLANLILNAYQSMKEQGVLTLSGRVEGDWMVLGVQDDGSGIQASDLPHLFEPFFTTKKHGSGLGLPISQKIMEAHGGRIEVQPVSPHGTLFNLYLPLTRPS